MINNARIAQRLDTKSTEKIFIPFGDLEAIIRTILYHNGKRALAGVGQGNSGK